MGRNFLHVSPSFSFSSLPSSTFYLPPFPGIDEVIDAMEYAVYVYDVEHIVLDNLQFMTGSSARGYEKFDVPLNSIYGSL